MSLRTKTTRNENRKYIEKMLRDRMFIVYHATEYINSMMIRISAGAEMSATNQRSAHFTTSFHFLIFSSSQADSVISSAPYTIAQIASSARSLAMLVTQLSTVKRNPQSKLASPGFTRSVPQRQPERACHTSHPPSKAQLAETGL